MSILRKSILFILQKVNRDVTIKHHYTKDKLFLNLYKHKGYWYYGKKRERETISNFYKLIKENDFVLEVGGHIGYMSLIYAQIVKSTGKVLVFEPGENNLGYLKKNVADHPQIKVVEKGAGDENKFTSFFIEDLTGQNNSFLSDYSVFDENNSNAINNSTKKEVSVEMVTLDSYFKINNLGAPNFIKIDVEGFELQVINGATDIIAENKTIFMIEVTMNHDEIFNKFSSKNYDVLNEKLQVIESKEIFAEEKYANRFFIPSKK